MKGSVRKRGNTWSYRVDFGKSADGKRNQIEKGGYKTKKEADKALNDVLFQYNNTGDYVENQKVTFQDVYKEFMATEAPATRAYATLKRYDSLYRNHYKDVFDGFYVYQITSNMVNDFISEKLKTYSEEYTKGLYKTLKVLMTFAHNRKYLKKNPFEDVTPPPDPRHVGDIRHYEPDEIARMGERLKNTNVKLSFYIALNTGLRESEVFGLQWSDIDFENRKIKVHKQLLFQDRKWCFCPLKTKNAYRSVNITESFCNYLKKVKAEQDMSRTLYGNGYKRNFITDRLTKNKEVYMEITDFVNVKDIEWSVSDETIANIDENGVLTATATGTITITATAKSGVTEEIEIEVYSNAGDTAAGILGLAVIGGGGAAWYYRRKKKKEAEAE